MRSSNKRSRNKNNRNRPSGGSIINRVFDSSGPEGKVRGTPQQIIDKYNQLTRDAQLSGDRVNAENFAQHAEHYTRMLAEAQREIDQKREQQEQQNQPRQQQNNDPRQQNEPRGDDGGQQGGNQPSGDAQQGGGDQPQPAQADGGASNEQPRKPRNRRKPAPPSDVIDTKDGDSSGLVETPENAPKPRRTRKPKAEAQGGDAQNPDDGKNAAAE
ncbi:DUF4167 domain-containing protein [Maribius pontilimi]|uniref:DUF4167 domain-containing protein n=1 Tax=Palleronia pontilimi TaxID=1964209 RepID=A0A934I7K3_9RHOB|nr:DUF4167 domain-containing protein [Palleronia pontilimi]MBJ3761708.1 DUF4167 domain-containing protein [Palleronia pontilimi]